MNVYVHISDLVLLITSFLVITAAAFKAGSVPQNKPGHLPGPMPGPPGAMPTAPMGGPMPSPMPLMGHGPPGPRPMMMPGNIYLHILLHLLTYLLYKISFKVATLTNTRCRALICIRIHRVNGSNSHNKFLN